MARVGTSVTNTKSFRPSYTPWGTNTWGFGVDTSVTNTKSFRPSYTPTIDSQQSTSNIPSDYLGSTSTWEQIRGNPFNPPATTERLPYWVTHTYTQGEPILVNDPIDVSSDTTLSTLPETVFLPSTPSLSQISPTLFPVNFPTNLDSRYQEQSSNNTPPYD